jgi:hypothetical protein
MRAAALSGVYGRYEESGDEWRGKKEGRGFPQPGSLLGRFSMETGRQWLEMGGWTDSIVASGLWSTAQPGQQWEWGENIVIAFFGI